MYLEDIFSLKNKVALVTGGSQGIGQGIALALAKAGANIALFSRHGSEQTRNQIAVLGRHCLDIKCDVTDETQVEAGMDMIASCLGCIDIVFNNAGICIHKDALDASVEEWRKVIDINLTGEYIVCRAAAKRMIEQNIHGSIINMASMSGFVVNVPQGQASYNASKAAVSHMSRSLAVEWAKYGIRVNSICPGYVATPMSTDVPEELSSEWLPRIPLGHRMCEISELVPAILYLACDAAGYTTGSDVVVDGGYTAI
jgi:sorbose reductase